MPAYLLPDAVYVCFTSDGGVFLDVRNDRYYGVDERAGRTLRAMLTEGSDADSITRDVAKDLVDRGLLTTVAARGRAFRPVTVAPAQASLVNLVTDDRPMLKLVDMVRFLVACVRMAFVLRAGSLERALEFLRRTTVRNPTAIDQEEVQRRVRVFRYLRPLVYASRDRCLYDSLVFSYFLRMNRIPSTLVIGVKTMPFAAHCWVQAGDRVVNGTPEFVRAFVPIFSI
jgi:hypothetical protein